MFGIRLKSSSRRKRPFLLLEILIALALFTACVLPLFRTQIQIRASEQEQIRRLQSSQAASEAFARIKEHIVDGALGLSHVGDSFSIEDELLALARGDSFGKWQKLSNEVQSFEVLYRLVEKEKKDQHLLLELYIVLRPPKQSHEFYTSHYLLRVNTGGVG